MTTQATCLKEVFTWWYGNTFGQTLAFDGHSLGRRVVWGSMCGAPLWVPHVVATFGSSCAQLIVLLTVWWHALSAFSYNRYPSVLVSFQRCKLTSSKTKHPSTVKMQQMELHKLLK